MREKPLTLLHRAHAYARGRLFQETNRSFSTIIRNRCDDEGAVAYYSGFSANSMRYALMKPSILPSITPFTSEV